MMRTFRSQGNLLLAGGRRFRDLDRDQDDPHAFIAEHEYEVDKVDAPHAAVAGESREREAAR